MLASGINTWPPTGSGRSSATDSVAPAVVMAIQNSGERNMRGFIFTLLAQGLWGRSVYNDDAESKINQSKFFVLTMHLVSPHPPESTPPRESGAVAPIVEWSEMMRFHTHPVSRPAEHSRSTSGR